MESVNSSAGRDMEAKEVANVGRRVKGRGEGRGGGREGRGKRAVGRDFR